MFTYHKTNMMFNNDFIQNNNIKFIVFFSIVLNLINLHLILINEVLSGKSMKPFVK